MVQQKPCGSHVPLQIQMQLGRRVPLEGDELQAWQEEQKANVAALSSQNLQMEDDSSQVLLSTESALSELHTRYDSLQRYSAQHGCCTAIG